LIRSDEGQSAFPQVQNLVLLRSSSVAEGPADFGSNVAAADYTRPGYGIVEVVDGLKGLQHDRIRQVHRTNRRRF